MKSGRMVDMYKCSEFHGDDQQGSKILIFEEI